MEHASQGIDNPTTSNRQAELFNRFQLLTLLYQSLLDNDKCMRKDSGVKIETKTYPQGSLLWPIEPIKLGRMKASCGQSFWVTNTALSQKISGVIQIARSGKNMGNAIGVSVADVEKFFKP